jgi:hypothetical protein
MFAQLGEVELFYTDEGRGDPPMLGRSGAAPRHGDPPVLVSGLSRDYPRLF